MSSKRRLRRTKCERKVQFSTMHLASVRAQQIFRQGGDLLTPYQCPHCHRYHLGHKPGTRQEHPSVALAAAF